MELDQAFRSLVDSVSAICHYTVYVARNNLPLLWVYVPFEFSPASAMRRAVGHTFQYTFYFEIRFPWGTCDRKATNLTERNRFEK